jgi:hypothetical protein
MKRLRVCTNAQSLSRRQVLSTDGLYRESFVPPGPYKSLRSRSANQIAEVTPVVTARTVLTRFFRGGLSFRLTLSITSPGFIPTSA